MRGHTQVVLELCWLSIFPDAEDAGIKVVTGILKVVGVSPEEGDRPLRCPDQPHISKPSIAIEVIEVASVEGHHITPQAGLLFFATLDLSNTTTACVEGVFR